MSRQKGDDLDDDFVPDDLVALSDEEEVGPDENIAGLLSAEEGEGSASQPSTSQQAATERKRKRREKEKERKKRKLAQTTEPTELPPTAALPPLMLAEYVSSMQAKTFSKMSGIELADVQIPERERHSRHDNMEGVSQSGSAGGLYLQDASHPAYAFVAEAQVQRVTDPHLCGWGGFAGGGHCTGP